MATEEVLGMVTSAACNMERCMLSTLVSISFPDMSKSMILLKEFQSAFLKLNLGQTGARVHEVACIRNADR